MPNGLRRAGSALAITACLALAAPALSQDAGWIGVWSASPQADWGPDFFAPVGIPRSLRDQTIRQVARVSLGGEQVRIELSNRVPPLTITVHGPDGRAVNQASVVVIPADVDRWIAGGQSIRAMRHVRTPASGIVRLGGLPPGSYLVAALAEGVLEGWPDRRVAERVSQVARPVRIDDGGSPVSIELQTQTLPGSR